MHDLTRCVIAYVELSQFGRLQGSFKTRLFVKPLSGCFFWLARILARTICQLDRERDRQSFATGHVPKFGHHIVSCGSERFLIFDGEDHPIDDRKVGIVDRSNKGRRFALDPRGTAEDFQE